MQPKDCLISDVSSIYAGKLLGNVAILDQQVPNVQKKVEDTGSQHNNTSNQSEKTVIRVSSEIADKFISKSEIIGNKQLPTVASKNFFKVGNCYQCKKRKFVFQSYLNYYPQSCQKTFCSECLNENYGEDIYQIIQTRTHWSTPFRRKICKTPSAILSTDTTGCKPENQTEEEEKTYVVDTFFKSQVKKTLELNHSLIKRMELYRGSMTTEEKLLGLKIVHDNLESLFSLKAAVVEHREPAAERGDGSYLGVVNAVSRDLQAKALADKVAAFDFAGFGLPEDFDLQVEDPEAEAEASLGKRRFLALGQPGDDADDPHLEDAPTYRSNKLRFDDHYD